MGELKMVATKAIAMPEHRHRRRERTEQAELTASIKAIGIQTPLKLAASEEGAYELVAGEGRLLAARELGIARVPAFIEAADAKRDVASRVAENMAREAISIADEAEEIRALLDVGYTTAQVSAITKLSKQRVSARLALVELPAELRELFAHGGLPASAAATVKALYDANPDLAQAIACVCKEDPEAAAECLGEEPGPALEMLARLVSRADAKVPAPFVVTMRRGDSWGRGLRWHPERPEALALCGEHGEWFKARWEAAQEWNRPPLAFSDSDLDAAVAYGAAFDEQGEYGCVYVHDRAWLQAHVNDVVLPRMRADAERAATERAQTAKAVRGEGAEGTLLDTHELARKLRTRFTRELRPRAQSANLDLGTALLKQLGTVKLSRELALFFAFEAIGAASERYAYGSQSHARALAECAARTLPTWIGVERKELKSGAVRETPTYLDGEEAERRMWRFIEEARSGEEVLGRTLILFACAARFQRECGANSTTPLNHYPAHAKARKALERIIARALPASIRRLEREKAGYDPYAEAKAMSAAAKRERAAGAARAKSKPAKGGSAPRRTAKRAGTSASAKRKPALRA